jgi:hypothetical protein
MKPLGSLPCSQQPTTNPHPESDEPSPHLTAYVFNIQFNIIPIYANVF